MVWSVKGLYFLCIVRSATFEGISPDCQTTVSVYCAAWLRYTGCACGSRGHKLCWGLSENGLIVHPCPVGTCFCCAPADVPFSDVALVYQTFCQCLCYRYTFGEGI
jgi:hypothetical protein